MSKPIFLSRRFRLGVLSSLLLAVTAVWATGTTSGNNNYFGAAAGDAITTGTFNSFFGDSAGTDNTEGSSNSFFGSGSGFKNTAGSFNSFLGSDAGFSNNTGNKNSFVGFHSGFHNTSGHQNAFVGYEAGYDNTSGSWNAFFGLNAGRSNTIASNNTAIGAWADIGVPPAPCYTSNGLCAYALVEGVTNATAVGHRAKVEQSNSLVLGSIKGVNEAGADTAVGIGTTKPAAPLHVKRSSDSATEMFRFENTGGSWLTWEKTSTNAKWYITHEHAAGGRMIIAHTFNDVGDGAEFALDTGGNLTIQGTLTEGSDVNAKQDIAEMEGNLVLAKLEQLPVSEWAYKANPESRHVGPMAQDFHKTFGLGTDETRISPRDMAGVSLAAVKELNSKLAKKDAEIAALTAQNDAVLARLAALEAKLAD